MKKKQVTLENLAEMVQLGFSQTATKQELNDFRKDMHDFRKDTLERFELIEADLRDVKNALGPLVRIVGNLKHEVRVLHSRLNRVERKVGIK